MISLDLIGKAVEALRTARFAIALTGAGISAESGIPTFRGKDGLWNKYRPEELATPEAFERNPKLVWEWYSWRLSIIINAKPNKGHIALAELERMGYLKAIITQNVDDLHERAGTKNLIKLHGNIRTARCTSCGYKMYIFEPPKQVPQCPKCGAIMRPDVVWFGEPLPYEALEEAFSYARRADLILVVGTSGVVYPAAAIPQVVKEHGGIVIEINIKPSALTPIADIFLEMPAGSALSVIVKRLVGGGAKP